MKRLARNMTSADDNRFFLPAWGISLTLHGAAVGIALLCAVQVKPVMEQNLFKWEVALIQSTQSVSEPKQIESTAKPAPAVKPRPEMVTHQTETRQPMQMVHPVMEPIMPIEPNVEPKIESVPVIEAKELEPVKHAEPVVASVLVPAHEPITDAAPASSVQQDSSQAPTSHSADIAPVAEEVPMQAARSVEAGSDIKADNRWLAESLWRRVAELKRYPSSARLSGQEGRVVLKAIIRADGQLAEVSVQKSSGHSVLDAAAIEAVKLACPLHMKHAIGKPEIVVSLPIVYSLAN